MRKFSQKVIAFLHLFRFVPFVHTLCYFHGIRAMEGILEPYPFPTNINVSNFVTIKLIDGNYLLWKTHMEFLLSIHRLLGFVNGHEKHLKDKIRVKFRFGK